jgi:hypothetical protein
MDEIWLIWVQEGEHGDRKLQQVARRTEEGAQRWCDENRKLHHGSPVQWTPECRTRQRIRGETNVTVQDQAAGKKAHETIVMRFYYLARLSVID